MRRSILQPLAVALGAGFLPSIFAIDTVSELIVDKYIGRWYQAYGNAFTARTITRDSTCIAADYGLDEATGNITVINSDREHVPTGALNTISGYAYGTSESEPGQLKVHLGQVPVDGDYWVVGLGPSTFGPSGAYEWAIVSGPEAESLFILVRDVPDFEKNYADEVLALVKDLGFTGPTKEPQRIVQEGCLPFDPNIVSTASGEEQNKHELGEAIHVDVEVKVIESETLFVPHDEVADEKLGWPDVLANMKWGEEEEAAYAMEKGMDTAHRLREKDIKESHYEVADEKLGWPDVLANMKWGEEEEAAYAMEEGMDTAHRLREKDIKESHYEVADEKLGWPDVLANMKWGEEEEAAYAMEEGMDTAHKLRAKEIKESHFEVAGEKLGWPDVLANMKWGEEEEAAYAMEEGSNVVDELPDNRVKDAELGWADVLANMKWGEEEEIAYAIEAGVDAVREMAEKSMKEAESWNPVVTVTSLDVSRFTGRWFQAYSSLTVNTLFEKDGACVTADYATQDDGSISVVNTARTKGVDGELIEMTGYAYSEDDSAPGKLKVHLDGVPVDAPYWVLALGNEDGSDAYPWTIVSDPWRAFLFVLVRDPETFSGSEEETDLLAKCKDLGFTAFWNSPRKTQQEGCEYPESVPTDSAESDKKFELSPALKMRGGGLGGLGGPLHASCKMTFTFPNSACEEVGGALVSAAEGMSGFTSCNGGNKCGYTVSEVAEDKIELVHETSVQHYKDSLTFDLVRKGTTCVAEAFSTSQTWYAVLDNSVNYCNLHNLVDACGLDYAETDVSDKTCTQYSSADCERY